jgi:nicotinamide phosphoribosyltransferase
MESERDTYLRLIEDVYPTGPVAVVSDTWDFWKVITETLHSIKDQIMARDGKLVIRPDSGDPVEILCGSAREAPLSTPEGKGLIQCLWEEFGGTVTENGYKVLDPHIGAIYGDSITLSRQEEILGKLKQNGFASSNVVLGIGSYTYQCVTRDTFGFAMKATYSEIDGEPVELFKDPKTGPEKKSHRGLIKVDMIDGEYIPQWPVGEMMEKCGRLRTVFQNGELLVETTLAEIRGRVDVEISRELDAAK